MMLANEAHVQIHSGFTLEGNELLCLYGLLLNFAEEQGTNIALGKTIATTLNEHLSSPRLQQMSTRRF